MKIVFVLPGYPWKPVGGIGLCMNMRIISLPAGMM
jgi:hypothetical protein